MIRKRHRYLVLFIVSLLLIVSLSGCGNKYKNIDLTNCIITSTITYEDSTWEVYKDTGGDDLYVFKNGELDTEDKYDNKQLKAMISLPLVEEARELDKTNKLTKNTYKSGIVASLEYVNSLKESGYLVEFEAKTPEFYELYLKSDKMDKYKRLIITREYLIEYNTDSINFKIDDYII